MKIFIFLLAFLPPVTFLQDTKSFPGQTAVTLNSLRRGRLNMHGTFFKKVIPCFQPTAWTTSRQHNYRKRKYFVLISLATKLKKIYSKKKWSKLQNAFKINITCFIFIKNYYLIEKSHEIKMLKSAVYRKLCLIIKKNILEIYKSKKKKRHSVSMVGKTGGMSHLFLYPM